MNQSRADELIRERLIYACQLALTNMTLEAKQRALETATTSELLLELVTWIPISAQWPDEERL